MRVERTEQAWREELGERTKRQGEREHNYGSFVNSMKEARAREEHVVALETEQSL